MEKTGTCAISQVKMNFLKFKRSVENRHLQFIKLKAFTAVSMLNNVNTQSIKVSM